MTPLLIATGGMTPCRSTLKVATGGFIGSCGVTGGREDQDLYRGINPYALALREDEELLMILGAMIEGMQCRH